MNKTHKPTVLERIRVATVAMLVSFAGLPASQATTFPQYPLLTGGSSIPPNILLILDDSGSMEYPKMPEDRSQGSMRDLVDDRSYINNTLYYNPARTYQPWRTASTDLSVRLGNANFTNVASSTTSPTPSASDFDLRDTVESYFYVPKSGVANPGTTASNYDKYRIATSSAADAYNGGRVEKYVSSGGSQLASGLNVSSNPFTGADGLSNFYSFTPDASSSVTVSSRVGSGGQSYQLEVYDSSNNVACSNIASGRNAVCTFTANGSAYKARLRVFGRAGRTNSISNGTITQAWELWQAATPTGRSQADELQNFANWYQYHRTRNKMAKAGASEAFGRLGKNYRVGFDTIWNRDTSGTTINVLGSTPAYPIPVGTDDGLFEDAGTTTNRTTFYSRLQGALASNGTPLHGALQRAGRYFATDSAWKDSSGNMLTCRQNYAILTTDGYWNQNDGFDGTALAKYTNSDGKSVAAGDGNGNVDKGAGYPYQDNIAYTLADVAYYYWMNDLRPAMTNNVRSSAVDPASWQHMVTFGVSIGQQGNYDPTGNAPNPFPDVWLSDTYASPPWTASDGKQRIDDLWHAAINGHGSFVVATDTDKFATALANALATIDARSASGSNVSSSSTKTNTSTLTFEAGFTSSSWIGEMTASPFNNSLTGVSTTPAWILSKTFGAGGVNQSFSSRTVLTDKDGVAALFNSAVTNASDFAARSGQADEVTAVDNIAYLRGDQSKEIGKTGGTLRARKYPFGDIVDSSPAYSTDTNTVYVGANDGMLHAIDASTGKVLFSYVPKGLDFTSMASLSSTSYSHHYFVDGQMDVLSRAKQGNNKNILVAALGRGGRGVFALDVTNPSGMLPGNVLWDNTINGTDVVTDKDMGYVLGPVRIRQADNGKTYALVPNGIDSPNGSATLYVYELNATGGIASKTPLVADAGSGNGLMALAVADLDGDGKFDTVYGGDLKGNVWRWDFSAGVPAAAVKLFTATDGTTAQPITGGMDIGRDTSGNIFVGFGTGSFISSSDLPSTNLTNTVTQSIYGIIDKGAPILGGRTLLQSRSIPFSGTSAAGESLRGFENYSALPAGKLGWYIDLPKPERVVSSPTVYGSAMVLASVIPASGSDCASAVGGGYLNAVDLFTGTSPGMSGGYFSTSIQVKDANGNIGTVGSVGISGGMPTQPNVTSGFVTVGTGAAVGVYGTPKTGGVLNCTGPNCGGQLAGGNGVPSRINWREIVPQQ